MKSSEFSDAANRFDFRSLIGPMGRWQFTHSLPEEVSLIQNDIHKFVTKRRSKHHWSPDVLIELSQRMAVDFFLS